VSHPANCHEDFDGFRVPTNPLGAVARRDGICNMFRPADKSVALRCFLSFWNHVSFAERSCELDQALTTLHSDSLEVFSLFRFVK
jgi:hypothetical protein